MNHMNVKEWGRSYCPWEEARAIYSAKGIDPKGAKNWGCYIIYPNRHRVVLKNNCQIFGSSVSELLFYVWSIFHLIGLRQNPFSPNEVKKNLNTFFPSGFYAFCVQLHHLGPTILICLPGNLNLELGCKEAWRSYTGDGGSEGSQAQFPGRSGRGVTGGFLWVVEWLCNPMCNPVSGPLLCGFAVPLLMRQSLFLHSLKQDWSCDLLWPIRCWCCQF